MNIGDAEDLCNFAGNAAIAEQHEDLFSRLGLDQPDTGDVPIDEDVGRVEDFGDGCSGDQRLADMREIRRNDARHWGKDAPFRKILLYFIETFAKLLAELIQLAQLRNGFGDFRLL